MSYIAKCDCGKSIGDCLGCFGHLNRLNIDTQIIKNWFPPTVKPDEGREIVMLYHMFEGAFTITGGYMDNKFVDDDLDTITATVLAWKYDDANEIHTLLLEHKIIKPHHDLRRKHTASSRNDG